MSKREVLISIRSLARLIDKGFRDIHREFDQLSDRLDEIHFRLTSIADYLQKGLSRR